MIHQNKYSTFYRACDGFELRLSSLMDLIGLNRVNTRTTVINCVMEEAIETMKHRAAYSSVLLPGRSFASPPMSLSKAHEAVSELS